MEAVLVTGANSGIGLYTTKLLAEKGENVIAGVRREETFETFDEMENVFPVLMDVTSMTSITTARETIRSAGYKIKGIVNNAGIIFAFPLIDVPEEEIRDIFEVNIFGVFRVTQTFIDDLIELKGRIVNISSISGIISGFAAGGYSMSKHAIEAYTDSLSKELSKFEILVSSVLPGNYNSNIGNPMRERIDENMSMGNSHYQEEFDHMQRQREKQENEEAQQSPEPIAVAEAVFHALTSDNPKVRYLVTDNQKETDMTMNKIFLEMLQLNQDHQYAYSKEELLEKISEMYDQNLDELKYMY